MLPNGLIGDTENEEAYGIMQWVVPFKSKDSDFEFAINLIFGILTY